MVGSIYFITKSKYMNAKNGGCSIALKERINIISYSQKKKSNKKKKKKKGK